MAEIQTSSIHDKSTSKFTLEPRNTDDELDRFLAKGDREAVEKAAKDFQKNIQTEITLQEESMKTAGTDTNDSRGLEILSALIKLMKISPNVANDSKTEKSMAELDMLYSPNSPFVGKILELVGVALKDLIPKEAVRQQLKPVLNKYTECLKKNGAELDDGTKDRYKKQFEVLEKIYYQLEKHAEVVDSPVSEADTEAVVGASEHVPTEYLNAEAIQKLGKLFVELTSHGYPPRQIVEADQESPLKTPVAAGDPNACSIM